MNQKPLEQKSIPKTNSDDGMQLIQIKGNVKNAYIKKIRSLIQISTNDMASEREKLRNLRSQFNLEDQSSNSYLFPDQELNPDARLKKNRESAKNSRQRKKLYIGLLEKKVEEFTNQIEILRQSTLISFNHIKQILQQNKPLSGMIIEQTECTQDLKSQKSKLAYIVDSYKNRFGCSGTKRRVYLKMCIKLIIKALLEGNYSLLLSDFSIIEEICENEEQKQKIMSIFEKLNNHKECQKSLIKQLKRQFKQLQVAQKQIEDVIEDGTDYFQPETFCQLIIPDYEDEEEQKQKQQQKKKQKQEYQQEQQLQQQSQQQQQQQSQQQNSFMSQFQLIFAQQQIQQQQQQLQLMDPVMLNELLCQQQQMIQQRQNK